MLKHATGVILPLPSTMLALGKVTTVVGNPQMIYKVRRLVPHKRHPGVDLHDLRVGNYCQTVAAGSAALDVFMPDDALELIRVELLEAKIKGVDAAAMTKLVAAVYDVANNLGAINTAQPGQRVEVRLFNRGAEPVLFEGHLLGDTINDDGSPVGGRFVRVPFGDGDL